MVSPIVSGVTPTATSLPLAIERPVLQINTAVKVTQSADTRLGGNSTQSDQAVKTPSQETQAGSVQEALEKVNESMKAWSTGVRFEIDEESEIMVVKLVDNTTGDTIRQMPSEAMLKVAKMIAEMRGGSIDTQA